MTNVNGKWQLEEYENGDNFMKALGCEQDLIDSVKEFGDPKNDIVQEYRIDDKEVVEIMTMGGEEKYRQNSAIGTDVPFTDMQGKKCKITTVVTKNEMDTTQDMGSFKAKYNLKVTGNRLLVKMSVGDVVATQKLSRVASKS